MGLFDFRVIRHGVQELVIELTPEHHNNIHDFLRAVKSYVHFGDRPLATTPSAKR